jgi:C1A family cysteine protease
MEFDAMKQKQPAPPFTPSRLFIYYNERVVEHSVNEDAGAMLRDGIKVTAKYGAPSEEPKTPHSWPYDTADFAKKPPADVYTAALEFRAQRYLRLPRNLNQMKGCLASGFPFVFGISVYESFESNAATKTGDVPMPGANERLLGGHAMLMVGYDDAKQRFVLRNSWGPTWGDKGYGTIPYSYLMDDNLSDDFWTIRLVG